MRFGIGRGDRRRASHVRRRYVGGGGSALVAPVYYKPDAYVHKPFLNVGDSRVENWTLTP
jgi:hypothetical protein